MGIAKFVPTLFIIPTQHVMEEAYRCLSNRHVPFDAFILIYLRYHRDVMNQEGTFVTLNVYEEYEDELQAVVIKYNRDKPFMDLFDSSVYQEVALGFGQINIICKDLFERLKKAENILGPVLASSLPHDFYQYKCEPIEARLYAGDLAIKFRPSKSLGVIDIVT